MQGATDLETLPPDLRAALLKTELIVRAYLAGLSFIVKDTGRDPMFLENHLLSSLSQDILQSSVSIITLAREGVLNVAKRELRFLIEASIKICFVQQKSYSSSIDEKLCEFDKELASQRISINKNLSLDLLPEVFRAEFIEEVGRLYGLTSDYVHLSPRQIIERIQLAEAGVFSGKERPSDVEELNRIAERAMAVSLVLLFHSVPTWVAGDWLVQSDGSTIDWYFLGSRFVAAIDSDYDYKHERQDKLDEIRRLRDARVKF